MADPVSITGLALQIGVALKQLYDYAKQAAGAKAEIKQLCLELSALRSLLIDCEAQKIPVLQQSALSEALLGSQSTVNDLLKTLTPSNSSIGRVRQSLVWPLKAEEVTKILSKLERTKTFLMLFLMGDIPAVRQDVTAMKRSVDTILSNQENYQEVQFRRKVVDWIAPVSCDAAHRTACATWKGSDSALWLVNGPLQQVTAHRFFILLGIPGTGKTTLFSKAVDHLSANAATPSIAYMYCRYDDTKTQDAANILGSWIAQVWPLKPTVLGAFYNYLNKKEPVPISVLSRTLVEIAESVGHLVLAVDALNECKDSIGLSVVLLDLTRSSTAITVLISSTPSDPAISQISHLSSCNQIALTAERMKPDIEEYIRREIPKHGVLQRMEEQEIIGPVLDRADGMFRWASCQMNLLAEQATPRKVRQALKHLPKTLNETYVSLLLRVSDSSKPIVREALLWLSLSQRPLELRELVEVVAFELEEGFVDDDCRMAPPIKLVDMCQGLVTLDEATENVSLAHGSIQAFLTSDDIHNSPAAYYAINVTLGLGALVLKCLSYLLMDQFNVGVCSEAEFDRFQEEYPLLNYASHFWAVYAATQEALTPEQVALIDRFFWTHRATVSGGQFTFWVNCILPAADRNGAATAEPLYYAASFGLTQIVASMLQDGRVSRNDDSSGWYIDHSCGRATSTALQVASWRGHTRIVSLLLNAGANPNSKNIVGATCLYCARRRGHVEIERLLVSVGAQDSWEPAAVPEIPMSIVRRVISEELGLKPSELTGSMELVDLGVDSLLAIQISARLRQETGLDLSPLFMLMNMTILDLEDNINVGQRLGEDDFGLEARIRLRQDKRSKMESDPGALQSQHDSDRDRPYREYHSKY